MNKYKFSINLRFPAYENNRNHSDRKKNSFYWTSNYD